MPTVEELQQQAYQNALQGQIKPPKTKSVYDMQRERVMAEQQDADQRRKEALQRQLASQGLQQGSGLAEKQMAASDLDARVALARNLGNVDIAESQAQEAAQEAEKQRQFATGERLGAQEYGSREAALNRALQEKQIMGNLSLEQQKVANQASQFGSEQEFKKYALEQGLSNDQAQRAWQSQENAAQRQSTEDIAYAGLSLEEKKLAQEASQFSSEEDFKKYALERGFDENAIQRTWQGYQNTLERKQAKELAYAGLNLEEQKLAQEAEQFKSEDEFKRYALERGIDEQEAQRAWQGYQNTLERKQTKELAYANLSLEEKKLAQDAEQFTSKQDFDKYALERGYAADAAQRAWQSMENARAQGATKELAVLDNSTKIMMQGMQNAFETGQIRLQDSLAKDKELRIAQAKQYYDMGAAGKTLSDTEARALQDENPIAYSAYMDGQAGKSLDEAQKDYEERIDQRNALVAGAALADPKLQDALLNIFNNFDTGDYTGSLSGSTAHTGDNPLSQSSSGTPVYNSNTRYRGLLTQP